MSEIPILKPDDATISWLHSQILSNYNELIENPDEHTKLASDLPSLDELALIISTTFWSSLKKEEGRPSLPCVYFGAARTDFPQWTFKTSLPFDSRSLAKLASGTDSERCYVGVSRNGDGELCIWGLSPEPVTYGLSIQAVAPGYLLVKLQTRTIAILKPGAEPVLLSKTGSFSAKAVAQGFLQAKFQPDFEWQHIDIILRIAKIMAIRRMGGTILFVKADDSSWTNHVKGGIPLSASPSLSKTLAALKEAKQSRLSEMQDTESALDLLDWGVLGYPRDTKERQLSEIARCIGVIARISSIDGAIVLDSRLTLLMIGAKIASIHQDASSLTVWQPKGPEQEKLQKLQQISLEEIGGTRHQSAANFAAAYSAGAALVVSQDGRVTLVVQDSGSVVALKLDDLI